MAPTDVGARADSDLPKSERGGVVLRRVRSEIPAPRSETPPHSAFMSQHALRTDVNRSQCAAAQTRAAPAKTPAQVTSLEFRDATYFYSSLVAGVVSGGISSVLCAPLDLIRVRMQVWGQVLGSSGDGKATSVTATGKPRPSSSSPFAVSIGQLLREIRDKEGYRGFFKGLGATLLTVPMFWAIYFPCYDEFKHQWHSHSPDTPSSLVHMGSAVAAGAISDVVCNPMFVVRTRLQTEALHQLALHHSPEQVRKGLSIAQTVRSLHAEGGWPVFWRGMTANLLGLSHVAIQFPLYERLKHVLQHRSHRSEPSAIDLLLASSGSKMLASLVSYPHEVVRSRMMDARMTHGVGFRAACRHIWIQEGWRGFYAGMPITLIRVIPNTCVTFVSYELLLRWARQQIQRRRDGS